MREEMKINMNYLKLQTDILKESDKKNNNKKNKLNNYFYGYYDQSIGIIYKGSVVCLIPQNLFYLNIEKVFENKSPFDVSKVINGGGDITLKNTNSVIKTGDKKELAVFYNADTDSKVYFNTKLLNMFGDDIVLKTSRKNQIALVYDKYNDNLIGVILPVKHYEY